MISKLFSGCGSLGGSDAVWSLKLWPESARGSDDPAGKELFMVRSYWSKQNVFNWKLISTSYVYEFTNSMAGGRAAKY